MGNKPISVLISDIHYSIANLALADKALRQAIMKANELNVQLWICGDLHDTKANIRGECLNALIKTLMLADKKPRILIGNHDKINEKSEYFGHSLTVLDGFYAEIIDSPVKSTSGTYFIPYFSDSDALRLYISGIARNSLLIMHQGIQGSNMGDYILDRSALAPIDVAGHRVISGHYHARQTIPLPNGGTWDYIGSPYTMSYGEANDPPKGFQILMDDGSLEFVPTNLRKHMIYETTPRDLRGGFLDLKKVYPDDLLWVRLHGTKEELFHWPKDKIAALIKVDNFRIDYLPFETNTTISAKPLSSPELLDSIIDSLTNTSNEQKLRIKDLWKTLA